LRFDAPVTRNYGTLDTFVVYMCMEGDFVIEYSDGKTPVSKGDTVLIPASIDEIGLIPDGNVTLLEVYVA
jgi:mannose-6-phosphate isomerase